MREAAALVLAFPVDGAPHVLLTLRAAGLRSHTGQVSFPGGAVDRDETVERAALREAHEEVGLPLHEVRLVGRLTPLHIVVSSYRLHPVVAIADTRPAFVASEWEVARVLEAPIRDLQQAGVVHRAQQMCDVDGQHHALDVPFYAVAGVQVWGATAMVLAEFLALLDP